MMDARLRARQYTREHGEDDPAIRNWVWPDARAASGTATPPADTDADLS